jgi:glycosyltransferase involved in cell wall biosynthesis
MTEKLKVIIQIPCFNEEQTLERTIKDLPTALPGVHEVEYLIIDDGSTDNTSEVGRNLDVDHVIRYAKNKGLAQAFQIGLDASLRFGADIIVNTDADNQYPGSYIKDLIEPIVKQEADIVVGDRQTQTIQHFSTVKRFLQKLGTSTVRALSGTDIADAPSGFRAYSKEAAWQLNVLTKFSYTLETIIQAGNAGLKIVNVPITTNAPTRTSRLAKNMGQFIFQQISTILRLYAFYAPLKTFSLLSMPFLLLGGGAWARFLWLYYSGQTDIGRHIQSLTIGTGVIVIGALIGLFGLHADISNKHRQLTQTVLYRLRKLESRLFSTERR